MNEHEKVNILMVDDQPAKLLTYETILSELGENLIKAGSGREALEHLLKTDIAVVLMDVSMPEIDGFELAAIIRQHPRYQKTAIIFISAVHLTDLDRLKGYAYGAVDYIAVPVIPDLLRAKVSVFAELYRLQAALQKSALEWQLTFDTIESPILILDLSGMVIRLNRAAKELLGNSYQESIGRTVEVLGSGQPWQKAAEIVRLIRETRCATSCQARDEASGRTWDMAASLLTGPGVAEERIILVARDITRMVELQASLRRSETMSAMGALVAGVAHEVRNPLFGISSILDAFEARFGAQAEYQKYLSILRGELDRLNRLMRELLEYGKPLSLEMSQGSIEDIIAEAVHACTPLAKRLRVEIATSLAEGLAPVRMDRGHLLEVFQNLLENAIQHSPPGGKVKVEAEEVRQNDHTWIDCAIKDSGPGFRMEDLPRIFEPFFTRRRGGTGLGLSIVQRIVEEHGGKISAGNRPEGGAIMAVRFPSVQR